jgi:hypothetical protein
MQPLAAAPSQEQGHGKIQLNQVLYVPLFCDCLYCDIFLSYLDTASGGNKLWLRDNHPISHSEVQRFAFTAGANSRGKVTLAWTDPAGSPLADVALVNDLDLVGAD